MLLVKARVGPSKIHGLGLIAQEFIPSGTIVWKLTPGFDVLLTVAELQELSPAAQGHVDYYGYFDAHIQKHVICGDDDRFSNHSDNANTRYLGDHAIAVRDIQPDEEITDNYSEFGKLLNNKLCSSALA